MENGLIVATAEYLLGILNSNNGSHEVWASGIEKRTINGNLLMCGKVNKFEEYLRNEFRSIVG